MTQFLMLVIKTLKSKTPIYPREKTQKLTMQQRHQKNAVRTSRKWFQKIINDKILGRKLTNEMGVKIKRKC